jgi:hypothetical protein
MKVWASHAVSAGSQYSGWAGRGSARPARSWRAGGGAQAHIRARLSRRYLRLPAVRPPTRCRSMRAKSTTTGTIAMTEAANKAFHCWTYAVT